MTAIDNMGTLGKESLDVTRQGFEALSQGVQTMTSEISDYNMASMRRGLAFLQALSGTRDLRQAIEVQNQYWRDSYENYVAEMQKLSEIWSGMAHNTTSTPAARGKRA